jgi:hypothetical protein
MSRENKIPFSFLIAAPLAALAGLPAQALDQLPARSVESVDTGQTASKGWYVLPGMGITFDSYRETGKADFSETMMTARIAGTYALDANWDAEAIMTMTAFPISSNVPAVTARFTSVNLRLGYAIPFISAPWRLSLLGGLYYTTMSVTDNAFGYQNLFYPQFLPSLSYSVDSRDIIRAYVKYVPTSTGFSIYNSTEREAGAGIAFEHRVGVHPISLSLEWADVRYFPDGSNTMENTATTVGLAYGL